MKRKLVGPTQLALAILVILVLVTASPLMVGTSAGSVAHAAQAGVSGTPFYLPLVMADYKAGTDGEITPGQQLVGPMIVQWFQAASNTCGINKLLTGQSVSSEGLVGHWWFFASDDELNSEYPKNKEAYFKDTNNKNCLADQWPALPTPTGTNTPVATGTNTPVVTVTNTVMPTGTTTPTPTVPSGVIAEGDFPGTALGAGIFEWALEGSCGIYNLLETETFAFNGQGHWWQFSSNAAMVAAYPAHKAAYFSKAENANCHEEFPHVAVTNTPTVTPQNTATKTPTVTATKTPTPTTTSVAPVEGGFPQVLQDTTIIEWSIPGESCGIFLLAHGFTFTWSLDGHWWKTGSESQTAADYPQHVKEFMQKTHGCVESQPPAETLGSASAPSIVEWYAVSNPAYCGVFELNFPKNWLADLSSIQVHSWRFPTQAEADADYPAHRDAFLAKPENATCIAGRPQ